MLRRVQKAQSGAEQHRKVPHMHFIYPCLPRARHPFAYAKKTTCDSIPGKRCYLDGHTASSERRHGESLTGDGIPEGWFLWFVVWAETRTGSEDLWREESVYDRGFSFFSFQRAKRPTPETLTTLNRTPGISPLALPRRPKPEIKTSSFSSTCAIASSALVFLDYPEADSQSSNNRHWERRR